MTISKGVQSGLFEGDIKDQQLIRIPIRAAERIGAKRRQRSRRQYPPSERSRSLWTIDEHDRFLAALELYPSGPWKAIADRIGTRTARQTMTHAQKYRQKIERRKLKERQEGTDGGSSSGGKATNPAAPASMLEITERAVLMEFLNNFQPSEIDNEHPILCSQRGLVLLDACF